MSLLPLALIAALFPGADLETPSLVDYAKKAQGRWAYGLYVRGKKAGYAIDELKVVQRDGKDVLRSVTETLLVTLFDGEKSVKASKAVVCYALEGEGRIVYAKVWRKDDGTQLTREAKAVPKGLRIVTTPKGDKPRTVPSPKETLEGHRRLEAWLGADRAKGDKMEKWGTAWEHADIDDKETYHFKGRKSVVISGIKAKVAEVVIESAGSKMNTELFADGRPHWAVLGGFMEMRLEPEKQARKLDGKLVDLLAEASVVLDRDLGPRGRPVDELALRVQGLGELNVIESHRQKAKKGKDGVVVALKRDYRIEKASPLSEEEAKRNTRATPRIQSGEEKVRAQARKIVGDEKDAGKRAAKLMAWVFRTLRKSYADNADTAMAVLENKAGDCTEHSLLFVALARSLGIPAREVGGLAYVRASKPMMAWHAWAEVHDGRQWVSVDPTWGQYQVDGTHWKMSEGSRDMAWANVVGTLRVKVVSVKKRGR